MADEPNMEEFDKPWTLTGEVRRLRFDVGQLREWKAAQEVNEHHLATDVATLTVAVQSLQTAIDRSRGALWVISGLSGAIGAGAAALVSVLIHHSP